MATRVAFGMVAMGFLLGALVFAHLGAWYWLRESLEPRHTALILAGVDLVITVVLAIAASRSSPDRIEIEALAVRQRALQGAAGTIAWSTIVVQVFRILGKFMARPRR
ncbi:MAG: hypothetical protein WDN25_16430 [Acetobacteraceae bacterium]